MLYIDYGPTDDLWRTVDIDFLDYFEMSWLADPFCLDMIFNIDHATWNGVALQSDIDGELFHVGELSTGTKALMVLYHYPELKLSSIKFGDNCTHFLLEIAKRVDITIYLEHNLHFPANEFRAFSCRKNKEYTSYEEYMREYLEVL